MRHITLLAACLLAAVPALAQQRSASNALGTISGIATSATSTPAPVAFSLALPTGLNQFATTAVAQAHCPSDTVMWANPRSKVYHAKGDPYFAHTKIGAFMCKRDAIAAGMHANGTTEALSSGQAAPALANH